MLGRGLIWLGIVLILGSCSTAGDRVTPQSKAFPKSSGPVAVVMQPQVAVQLPVKSTAFAKLPTPSQPASIPTRIASSAGGYLRIAALKYSDELPSNRVARLEETVKFSPAVSRSLSALAHCAFEVDALGAINAPTIALDWQDAPPPAYTFVGVGNLRRNTWTWFQADEDGVITLHGWRDYMDPDRKLLITVLVTGDQRGLLRAVNLGQPEQRATGLVLHTQPEPTTPPLYVPALPESIDLSSGAGPARDQGTWEACTAFAFAGGAYSIVLDDLYGRLGRQAQDPQFELSPKYIYIMSGRRFGWPDSGEYGRGLLEVGPSPQFDGAALEPHAPYDFLYNTNWSADTLEDRDVLKVDTLLQVPCFWEEGRQSIKGWLANGRRAVVVGMSIDEGLTGYQPGTVYTYMGPAVRSHAMCIVGYDDSRQAYKVRNSWGTSWGEDGHCWMSYETFDVPQVLAACYVIDDSYDPAVVARFLPDGDFLQPPMQLKATRGTSTGRVHLSWKASPGAISYKAYRDNRHNVLATVQATNFADLTAVPGYSHMYWVSAVSGELESAHSNSDVGFTAPAS